MVVYSEGKNIYTYSKGGEQSFVLWTQVICTVTIMF